MIYKTNIEKETLENENFRKVLRTTKNMQLVLMSLNVNEEIGEETHNVDQFIRIERGEARSILNGMETILKDDDIIIIPAGTRHNIINIGNDKLKLYTIYATPEHQKDEIHPTKEYADKHEKHFDGEVDY